MLAPTASGTQTVEVLTIIGQVVTSAGDVKTVDRFGDNPEWYSLPANAYMRHQKAGLAIHMNHDRSWRLGTVTHLERSRSDGLMMVGRIERDDLSDLLEDGDWFISDSVRSRATGFLERGHGVLEELSLVRQTGNMGTRPLRWSRSDLATDSGGQPFGMPLNWHGTWERAHERMSALRYRRASDRLSIEEVDPLGIVDDCLTDPAAARQLLAEAKEKLRAMPPPAPKPAPTLAPTPPSGRRVRWLRHLAWRGRVGQDHRAD